MSSPVQILWENNQLFGGVDGIVYPNKIIEIEYIKLPDNERVYKSVLLGETTLQNILKDYPDPSSEILPNGTIASFPNSNNILEIGMEIQIHPYSPLAYKNDNIYFGEGAMGNEGFVALVDAYNHLLWSIAFDLTNPIVSASITEDYLYLLSTNNTKVKINLNKLTEVEIFLPECY